MRKVFTITQDCRFRGKHCKAGDKIILDLDDWKDTQALGSLMQSGRVLENPYSESSPPIADAGK